MGTQGVLAVTRAGRVLYKVVVGCDGFNVPALAAAVRERRVDSPDAALEMAKRTKVGCPACRVVVSPTVCLYEDEDTGGELAEQYRRRFDDPRHNPRWERGTADYVEVVDL